MNQKGFNEAQNHKIVYRPWGSFLSIEEGKTWQIKKKLRLILEPLYLFKCTFIDLNIGLL